MTLTWRGRDAGISDVSVLPGDLKLLEPDLYLLRTYPGDSCPARYRLIFLTADRVSTSEPFGNCNDFDIYERGDGVHRFLFAACEECGRRAEEVLFRAGRMERSWHKLPE
ncbi:MAG: hypothetical protein HS115_00050 [Spirochaetales bacterium]|nr:hypothetical protein [Spirochaetales bacterium]